jgi:hypothetical protein
MAVTGLATIVASVALGVGGVAASATGVGAPVGVPAVAVAWEGVAVGAAAVGAGVLMMAGSAGKGGEDWAVSKKAKERAENPPDYTGKPVPAKEKYDPDAHDLAERINEQAKSDPMKSGNAQAQATFPNYYREFDVISDDYIGQAKPPITYGSEFRDQAQITFEAAIATGRTPYFHFNGVPDRDVLRALERYKLRYGQDYVLDLVPF